VFVSYRQDLMYRASRLAASHLNARLLTDADVSFARTVVGTVRNRNRKPRKGSDGGGLPDPKLFTLQLAYSRDKGQMIILPAFVIALLLPTAYLAVRCRFRIGFSRVAVCVDHGMKPRFTYR